MKAGSGRANSEFLWARIRPRRPPIYPAILTWNLARPRRGQQQLPMASLLRLTPRLSGRPARAPEPPDDKEEEEEETRGRRTSIIRFLLLVPFTLVLLGVNSCPAAAWSFHLLPFLSFLLSLFLSFLFFLSSFLSLRPWPTGA